VWTQPVSLLLVDGRALDTLNKTAELESLTVGSDAGLLWDAVIRARIALEFRGTDAMIGLPPTDAAATHELSERLDRAVDRAVELGFPPALVDRANTIYFSQDTTRAAEAFAAATAATGEPRATYLLGLFHHAGFGCDEDQERSRALHEAAAEAGEPDAMFELYVYHSTGVGGPIDKETALDWCHRAADAGNARAMSNLGGFYATGSGVPADLATSLTWYTRAAEHGNGRAAAVAGIMTALGQGTAPAPHAAARWFDLSDDLGYDWRPLAAASGLDLDNEDD
jgi:TPR repeat protein